MQYIPGQGTCCKFAHNRTHHIDHFDHCYLLTPLLFTNIIRLCWVTNNANSANKLIINRGFIATQWLPCLLAFCSDVRCSANIELFPYFNVDFPVRVLLYYRQSFFVNLSTVVEHWSCCSWCSVVVYAFRPIFFSCNKWVEVNKPVGKEGSIQGENNGTETLLRSTEQRPHWAEWTSHCVRFGSGFTVFVTTCYTLRK